jgi:TetR/AcrR family transcriptional regulator, lmrAB and yxaGH operons repressor
MIFSLMAKDLDSKGKTLAAAADLFRRQGYFGTALQDILAAAGSPRGSLYFHFPDGKEQIGEAALKLAGDANARAIAQAAAASKNAEAFLLRLIRGMAAHLENTGFRDGCPIATTALETAVHSEALRGAARDAFQKWETEIRRGLERFAIAPEDAASIATCVLSQLEGALLLARTYRSLEPMQRAERVLTLLLRPRESKA